MRLPVTRLYWLGVFVSSIYHDEVVLLRIVTANPKKKFPPVTNTTLAREMYMADVILGHGKELCQHLNLLSFYTAIEFVLRDDEEDPLDWPFNH